MLELCPHLRCCPDVCRYRPIRWLAVILRTYRAVGTAGRSSSSCSSKLFTKKPSRGGTRVVLQFSPQRAPRRVLYFLKYGMVSASNFSIVSRLVYSVGIKHVPQVQLTTPSAQNFKQYEHWGLGRDLAQLEAFHVPHIMNHLL